MAYATRLGWAVLPLHSVVDGLCTCGNLNCPSPGKHPLTKRGVKDASKDPAQIIKWWQRWPWANVGVATGQVSGLFVLDIDGEAGEESLRGLEAEHGKLPDTVEQLTGSGGRHLLFKHPAGQVIGNKVRIAPGLDVRGEGGYIVVAPSTHASGRQYAWEVSSRPGEVEVAEAPGWLLGLLREESPRRRLAPEEWQVDIPEGQRNVELTRRAGSLLAKGIPPGEVLTMLKAWNEVHCKPPLPEEEVERIVKSIAGREVAKEQKQQEPEEEEPLLPAPSYPDPPGGAAFYGLAGDVVRVLDPYTEADPVALLVQFLVFFGNCIGRSAFFVAEADKHHTNEFVVLVGTTAKGRKGSSFGHIRALFARVDPEWSRSRVQFGLSSGEGLIWAVHDPIEKLEPVFKGEGRNKEIIDYKTVVVDPGVEDKRLLVYEAEFASTLRVLQREGNTLSAIVRNAWDTGELQSLTKNAQARATGAHISIIGHITKDELLRYLDTTEAGNGFGNRFLWVCVKRSKLLPLGGRVPEEVFAPLVDRVLEAAEFAREVKEVSFDEEATQLWCEVYPALSEGKPGLLGAITARAEAHVARLATIYALLDLSRTIGRPHLEAALAVWDYCERSARFIFSDSLGDPVADEILEALRKAGEKGLTRTEIRDLFNRHVSGKRLTLALGSLAQAGLARAVRDASRPGRPVEKWFAVQSIYCDKSDLCDKTDGTRLPGNTPLRQNSPPTLPGVLSQTPEPGNACGASFVANVAYVADNNSADRPGEAREPEHLAPGTTELVIALPCAACNATTRHVFLTREGDIEYWRCSACGKVLEALEA